MCLGRIGDRRRRASARVSASTAATWPKRAERVVEGVAEGERQLILAGVLEAPEENGRWPKANSARGRTDFGGGSASRSVLALDDGWTTRSVLEDADVASRMLDVSRGGGVARAHRGVGARGVGARDPAADAPAPAPPRPFRKTADETAARTPRRFAKWAQRRKNPSRLHAARQRAATPPARRIHPHTAMDDFHEEAALARDVDALNARRHAEAHAASVHRRATQTYIDAMTRPMVTDAGREGPVSASAKAASAKAANPGRRDDDDWRRIEGYAGGGEADGRRDGAHGRGWVRDPETNTYVPMQEYLARWAPPKARILGVGGWAGRRLATGSRDWRRSAKDREDAAACRIRREWNDANYEVRDVRGDGVFFGNGGGTRRRTRRRSSRGGNPGGWRPGQTRPRGEPRGGGDVGETTAGEPGRGRW